MPKAGEEWGCHDWLGSAQETCFPGLKLCSLRHIRIRVLIRSEKRLSKARKASHSDHLGPPPTALPAVVTHYISKCLLTPDEEGS